MPSIFFDFTPTMGTVGLLLLAMSIALAFEAVNGFHDTANAVATVIYTRSLKPVPAVVLSGLCNFFGVMFSGVGVAYSIVNLLPVEVLVGGVGKEFVVIYAILLGALVWNLGTWYYGIPASSSHTLIGAVVGVGLTHSLTTPGLTFGQGVHWSALKFVMMGLVFSPLIGFGLAWLMLTFLRALSKDPDLYHAPEGDDRPPLWIRGLLISTCAGVSWAHGSNDGQKGMGLMMLIMIGLVPVSFALDLNASPTQIQHFIQVSTAAEKVLESRLEDQPEALEHERLPELELAIDRHVTDPHLLKDALTVMQDLRAQITQSQTLLQVPPEQRWPVRKNAMVLYRLIMNARDRGQPPLSSEELMAMRAYEAALGNLIEYVSPWVKFLVALAIGLGTMVGWKRVVVTVGEKIGKDKLNYAQGLTAQTVAMATIMGGDHLGLPVSTTHILSSGVAGSMVANGSTLQRSTLRSIILAWVLTLPASMLLASGLYMVLGLLAR